MTEPIRVLGISGSLRKGSFNTAALHAAAELVPDGMTIDVFDIADIPLYNADLDHDPLPFAVQAFKDTIAEHHALLIATPEYNYSIPGVLKNAIDWASRPAEKAAIYGKPVAMMGAAPGMFGTVRAQMHWRDVFAYLNMPVVNKPAVLITKAREKFDADGKLHDADTRKFIRQLLENLLTLTRRYVA